MPEHRIYITPTNPGLVFACCGLFELAAAQDAAAMAHFSPDATTFRLETSAQLPPPMELAPSSRVNPNPFAADSLAEVELLLGPHRLVLNWWLTAAQDYKSPLKTWCGHQTPRNTCQELLALLDFSLSPAALFSHAAYTTTRFGVDPRTAWNTLQAGYSPNEVGQSSVTYPWVEILAAVGLQGFRPALSGTGGSRSLIYSLWLDPLSITPARAALPASWSGLRKRSYSSVIGARGQGYKTLLLAKEQK